MGHVEQIWIAQRAAGTLAHIGPVRMVSYIRLIYRANVVAGPGLGLLQVVPGELAGALCV